MCVPFYGVNIPTIFHGSLTVLISSAVVTL